MKPKVYVALSTFAKESVQPLDSLRKSGLYFDVNPTQKRLTKQEVVKFLQDYDGVIAGLEPYDREVLNSLPQLKCISRCGVGMDNIDLRVAQQRQIKIFNTPDAVVSPVVELTLALILDLLRQTTAHTILMKQHRWEKLSGFCLAGKIVGVIGLGRIGRKMAEVLISLDAQVVGYDINPDNAWAHAKGINLMKLPELLRASDIVTLHLSPAAEHPFCLGASDFAHMKKGSYLINTARGSLVDEQALYQALHTGYLAGAGLDVYGQEPYQGHLCDLTNVVLSPHCATLTQESRSRMESEAVENIIRFFL